MNRRRLGNTIMVGLSAFLGRQLYVELRKQPDPRKTGHGFRSTGLSPVPRRYPTEAPMVLRAGDVWLGEVD